VAVALALAGAAIMVLAALFTTMSTMVIAIGLVAVLAACYRWRAHGRRRYHDVHRNDVP
jgi:hypothetical protein